MLRTASLQSGARRGVMRLLSLLILCTLAACSRQPMPGPDVSRRLMDGIRKAQQNQARDAVADFTAILNADPGNALAHSHRGFARTALGDTAGAADDFTAATRLSIRAQDTAISGGTGGAAAYTQRGILRSDLGDYDGAIADYSVAIRLEPRNAWAYFQQGNARFRRGDVTGAIADYDRAVSLAPAAPEAYLARALAKEKVGDSAGAVRDFAEARRLSSESNVK